MITTKEIKVIKYLDIPYIIKQQDDVYRSYVKDYSLGMPHLVHTKDLEFIETTKLTKATKHKVVICHNKVMLWCPIFQYFYVKAINPLGLLLSLTVKKCKGRYVIAFSYRNTKFETSEYKEIREIWE